MNRLACLLITAAVTAAWSTPVTFFGEDLGLGEGTPLTSWANADATRADFFSNLQGVEVFNFESVSGNAPIAADFGTAGTATITGSGSVTSVTPGSTNGNGRYAISGSNYYEATDDFTINFSNAISAFGFYGIDIGDFGGQVTLNMTSGLSTVLTMPNSINIRGGSVCYFGFYDVENAYSSITFGNTAAGTDYFGFDDFTIGIRENVVPSVPEPATMSLIGIGILGLAFLRKRIR
ncbi:MAG: PEP-CTERM sorting domain-containing protein [Fibrobacter sp.]|nr:PEP-CTERM sorting domain-containing protein [Fibrobacter sp.]